jgi:hypothetical protein
MVEDTLESLWFQFTPNQLDYLVKRSRPAILRLGKELNKGRQDLQALFQEIKEVDGNWERKNTILKAKNGLFWNLQTVLETILNEVDKWWVEVKPGQTFDKESPCYPIQVPIIQESH